MGDGDAPPYIKIANTWLILNVGGGPTPDKPTVTLRTPPDLNEFSSFMNIRVADIQACYKLWKSRGATSTYRTARQVRRDALLHPRSQRLHHRSRAKQTRVQVWMKSRSSRRTITCRPNRGLPPRFFSPLRTSSNRFASLPNGFRRKGFAQKPQGPDDPAYVQIANTWLIFNPGVGRRRTNRA